MLAELF